MAEVTFAENRSVAQASVLARSPKGIPIIFSAPMVRALLDGRKTQTRRLLKPQPPKVDDFPGSVFGLSQAVADGVKMYSLNDYERLPKHPTKWDLVGSVGVARDAGYPTTYSTRYAVGDRLWVRENVEIQGHYTDGVRLVYDASRPRGGSEAIGLVQVPPRTRVPVRPGKPRPSSHMPRWASRITLVVDGVKVERLQDISEDDARAEGMVFTDFGEYTPKGTMSVDGGKTYHSFRPRQHNGWHFGQATGPDECMHDAVGAFSNLWRKLHGDNPGEAWSENPWIVALTFTVHLCNIDALSAEASNV